jgi:glycosyltransferase involved in cell wall biosynthesis
MKQCQSKNRNSQFKNIMKEVSASQPLVSVGIPTYERPELLDRALKSLVAQTYSNLEIIVSDNCSVNPEVNVVLDRWSRCDSRVRVFRQALNIGGLKNFNFVLNQARADWFMWVADDDYLAPCFVEKCMDVLLDDAHIVLCTMETQCIFEDGSFMSEVIQGNAYRKPTNFSRLGRMKHLLKNNFGSLIYGLFRKDVLFDDSRMFWAASALITTNEIPPLLNAAKLGEIIVLPDKGIYKTVTAAAHSHLQWVVQGGRLPQSNRISGIHSLLATWSYCQQVMLGIDYSLKQLKLNRFENMQLSLMSKKLIVIYFVWLVLTYKPVWKSGYISCS